MRQLAHDSRAMAASYRRFKKPLGPARSCTADRPRLRSSRLVALQLIVLYLWATETCPCLCKHTPTLYTADYTADCPPGRRNPYPALFIWCKRRSGGESNLDSLPLPVAVLFSESRPPLSPFRFFGDGVLEVSGDTVSITKTNNL